LQQGFPPCLNLENLKCDLFFLNDATKWNPHKDDLVPEWAVVIFGVVALLLCSVFEVIMSYERYKHKSILAAIRLFLGGGTGACFAVTMTNIFKVYVGKLRPDFSARCMGDTPEVYTNMAIYDDSFCTGDTGISLVEGRKSYPSGHATSAFAFSTFVSAYLLWCAVRLRVERRWRLVSQLVVFLAMFPWIVAFWVCCTRILDNKHDPEDVNGGAIVGVTFALFIFVPLYFSLKHEYAVELNPELEPVERRPSTHPLLSPPIGSRHY